MQTITNSENASPEQQDKFVIVHTHAEQGKKRGTWTAKEKIHNTNPKKKIKRIRDTILYGFA